MQPAQVVLVHHGLVAQVDSERLLHEVADCAQSRKPNWHRVQSQAELPLRTRGASRSVKLGVNVAELLLSEPLLLLGSKRSDRLSLIRTLLPLANLVQFLAEKRTFIALVLVDVGSARNLHVVGGVAG